MKNETKQFQKSVDLEKISYQSCWEVNRLKYFILPISHT